MPRFWDRAKTLLTAANPAAVSAHLAKDSAEANALAAAPRHFGGTGILTNLVSGLNTTADQTWWDTWLERRPLGEYQARVLGLDPFVRRLLSIPGEDATREPWTTIVKDDLIQDPAEVSKTIRDYEEREGVNLAQSLRDAERRSRQYGASLILLGIDDGRDSSQPVDWGKVKRIWWTAVVDWRDFDYGKVIGPRGEIEFVDLGGEDQEEFRIGAQKFGQVQSYRVTDLNSVLPDGVRYGDGCYRNQAEGLMSRGNVEFHADRVLWIPYREALPLLDQMQDALAAYFRGLSGISRAIDRASLMVLGVANHVAKSWADDKNHGIGQKRLRDLMSSWSAMSAVVIDKTEETITNQGGGSTSGLADAIYPIESWLAALSGIPHIRLWGESPGGFGTGESERAQYHDMIRSVQDTFRPHLRHFARLVLAAHDSGLAVPVLTPDRIKIKFEDLDRPTDLESIEILAKKADIAQKLSSLFLESELRSLIPEIELDREARQVIRAREIARKQAEESSQQGETLTAQKSEASAAAIDAIIKVITTSKTELDPMGLRALAVFAGVDPLLAAQIFKLAPAVLPAAPGAPGAPVESPDNPDGQGLDPANDAPLEPPPPPPPPSRFIPSDARPARVLAEEFNVPTRTITLLADKGKITRYYKVGGKQVFSHAEVVEAERLGNLSEEEIAAEEEAAKLAAEEAEAAEAAESEEREESNEGDD